MESQVVFAASGGSQVGLGHVRRCMSLADALGARGVASSFLVQGDSEAAAWVAAAGYSASPLPSDGDFVAAVARAVQDWRPRAVVVDSYAWTSESFRTLLAKCTTVAAIDDLADREMPVHLLVNGGVGAERLDYRGLPETRYLLGPAYLLLRPAFAEEPRRETPAVVRRALVAVGGSDPHGLLPRLVRWTRQALPDAGIDVIVSPLSDGLPLDAAEDEPGRARVTVHRDPADVRGLMLGADLALCAGGQMTYELAATGTPALAVQIAANQAGNLRGLAAAGALQWVGAVQEADLDSKVTGALGAVGRDPALRARMSRAGRALVDGQGAERVAAALLARAETR